MKYIPIPLFLILMVFLSCANPQRSYDKGKYEKAYKSALKNLNKGNRSRKDKTVLNNSFKKMLNQSNKDYKNFANSELIEDWERGYRTYDKILDLYDDGQAYLDDSLESEIVQIEVELNELQEAIATNYYRLGDESMESFSRQQNKLMAQDAFLFYEKSVEYGGDYDDLGEKMDQASEEGTIVVMVEAGVRWGFSNDWEIDRRFSDVERESERFLEVHYERNGIEVDCHYQVEFEDVQRNVRDSRDRERFTERIEDGYETRTDTSGNVTRIPIYATVEGYVDIIREEITYRIEARTNIQGNRDYCGKSYRNFQEDETVVNERYEISGDTRAIPDRYRNSRTNTSKREDNIIDDLIEEIYDEFVRFYF